MNSEKIKEASRQVIEKINAMSKEELQRMVDEISSGNDCSPDTCHGGCQGMGGCQTCIEFRAEQGIVLPRLIDYI